MIIAVVVGALLLSGLYVLFNNTVLPGLVERIQDLACKSGRPDVARQKTMTVALFIHDLNPTTDTINPQLAIANCGKEIMQYINGRNSDIGKYTMWF